jgi:NAD(P)-dependent dehydrogenase (short-subunit alcohol dehydrogenase family)
MQLDFDRKHVVITGATGALGHALAELLVEAGAICHLPVRDAAKLAPFKTARPEQVSAAGGIDLGDESSVARFYTDLPELWASMHCVGAFSMRPFAETKLADLQAMLSANLVTSFLCSREALRAMASVKPTDPRTGRGRIVNVTAAAGLEPRRARGMVGYGISKSAIAAMTQSLAEEVVGQGVLVNAVAPSLMDTPENRKAMPKGDFASWPSVSEVAWTMAFLASPQNRTTQGAVVPVYGRG